MEIAAEVINLISSIILLFVAITSISIRKASRAKTTAKTKTTMLRIEMWCIILNFIGTALNTFFPFLIVGFCISLLSFLVFLLIFTISESPLNRMDITLLVTFVMTIMSNSTYFLFRIVTSVIDKIVTTMK